MISLNGYNKAELFLKDVVLICERGGICKVILGIYRLDPCSCFVQISLAKANASPATVHPFCGAAKGQRAKERRAVAVRLANRQSQSRGNRPLHLSKSESESREGPLARELALD